MFADKRRPVGLCSRVVLSVGASIMTLTAAAASNPSDCRKGGSMTPKMYQEYVRRFNAQDDSYGEFYADDVVFDHGPVFGILKGRQAVVDFYRAFWPKFHETLEIGAIVIDNEHGQMAVEVSTHLVARQAGVALPSHPQGLHPGDEFVTRDVVIYTLCSGKITHIRGAVEGQSFTPHATNANAP